MKAINSIKEILIASVCFGIMLWLFGCVSSRDGYDRGYSDMFNVGEDIVCALGEEEVVAMIDTLDVMAHAFAMVESTDNPKAYNKSSGAAGWLQLKPIMVEEANRIKNINSKTKGVRYFNVDDRWDKEKSKEMFKVVMGYRNPSLDIKKACVIWNYTHTERYYQLVVENFNKIIKEKVG